jgi:hypothetical protein
LSCQQAAAPERTVARSSDHRRVSSWKKTSADIDRRAEAILLCATEAG